MWEALVFAEQKAVFVDELNGETNTEETYLQKFNSFPKFTPSHNSQIHGLSLLFHNLYYLKSKYFSSIAWMPIKEYTYNMFRWQIVITGISTDFPDALSWGKEIDKTQTQTRSNMLLRYARNMMAAKEK